jgi:hypothetical protein
MCSWTNPGISGGRVVFVNVLIKNRQLNFIGPQLNKADVNNEKIFDPGPGLCGRPADLHRLGGRKIKRYIKSKMAEKPHDEKALVIIDSAKTFAESASGQYYLLRVKLEKDVPLPAIEFSKAGGRNLVINLETWPGKLLVSTDFNVLEAVSNGDFDKTLEEFCSQVKRLNVPVFLRFNPEMELP